MVLVFEKTDEDSFSSSRTMATVQCRVVQQGSVAGPVTTPRIPETLNAQLERLHDWYTEECRVDLGSATHWHIIKASCGTSVHG